MTKLKLRVSAPYVQHRRYSNEIVIKMYDRDKCGTIYDEGDLGEVSLELADCIQELFFDSDPPVDSDFEYYDDCNLDDWEYEIIEVIED